jgi:hypothetical protein
MIGLIRSDHVLAESPEEARHQQLKHQEVSSAGIAGIAAKQFVVFQDIIYRIVSRDQPNLAHQRQTGRNKRALFAKTSECFKWFRAILDCGQVDFFSGLIVHSSPGVERPIVSVSGIIGNGCDFVRAVGAGFDGRNGSSENKDVRAASDSDPMVFQSSLNFRSGIVTMNRDRKLRGGG